MAYLPKEFIEEVRSKVNIVDVISQYVQLKPSGSNYTASCPFHEDNNPSFSVHTQKQIYKCFSCGRGGNVFGFLQEVEGIEFIQAVLKLAEDTGINVPESYKNTSTSPKQNAINRLIELHEETSEFYHFYLLHTKGGVDTLEYLRERGFLDSTIESFKLGYAPEEDNVLYEYLIQKDFTKEELLASGIFFEREDGSLVDRFSGRLIIPLRDHRKKTIAFSGRILPNTKLNTKAKYINSPETDIFNKTKTLYNLDQARPVIRQKNQVLIAEGYMDVMSLHQAGYTNVVASMGTSLTSEHLAILSKLTSEVVFVFDGDEAGQEATRRAFELSQSFSSLNARAVIFPDNLDPDDWFKLNKPERFEHLIKNAIGSFEFLRERLKNKYNLNDQQQLSTYIEELIDLIAKINSPVEKQLRIQELVAEYNLDEGVLQEELVRSEQKVRRERAKSQQEATTYERDKKPKLDIIPSIKQDSALDIKSNRAYQSEKMFIGNLIFYEEAWKHLGEYQKPVIMYHSFSQDAYIKLQHYYYEEGNHIPLTGITEVIDDPMVSSFLTSVIWDYDLIGFSSDVMDDCLQVIDEEYLTLQIDELKDELKAKQKQQEYNDIEDILHKLMHLTRKLKDTKSV